MILKETHINKFVYIYDIYKSIKKCFLYSLDFIKYVLLSTLNKLCFKSISLRFNLI